MLPGKVISRMSTRAALSASSFTSAVMAAQTARRSAQPGSGSSEASHGPGAEIGGDEIGFFKHDEVSSRSSSQRADRLPVRLRPGEQFHPPYPNRNSLRGSS